MVLILLVLGPWICNPDHRYCKSKSTGSYNVPRLKKGLLVMVLTLLRLDSGSMTKTCRHFTGTK